MLIDFDTFDGNFPGKKKPMEWESEPFSFDISDWADGEDQMAPRTLDDAKEIVRKILAFQKAKFGTRDYNDSMYMSGVVASLVDVHAALLGKSN